MKTNRNYRPAVPLQQHRGGAPVESDTHLDTLTHWHTKTTSTVMWISTNDSKQEGGRLNHQSKNIKEAVQEQEDKGDPTRCGCRRPMSAVHLLQRGQPQTTPNDKPASSGFKPLFGHYGRFTTSYFSSLLPESTLNAATVLTESMMRWNSFQLIEFIGRFNQQWTASDQWLFCFLFFVFFVLNWNVFNGKLISKILQQGNRRPQLHPVCSFFECQSPLFFFFVDFLLLCLVRISLNHRS